MFILPVERAFIYGQLDNTNKQCTEVKNQLLFSVRLRGAIAYPCAAPWRPVYFHRAAPEPTAGESAERSAKASRPFPVCDITCIPCRLPDPCLVRCLGGVHHTEHKHGARGSFQLTLAAPQMPGGDPGPSLFLGTMHGPEWSRRTMNRGYRLLDWNSALRHDLFYSFSMYILHL